MNLSHQPSIASARLLKEERTFFPFPFFSHIFTSTDIAPLLDLRKGLIDLCLTKVSTFQMNTLTLDSYQQHIKRAFIYMGLFSTIMSKKNGSIGIFPPTQPNCLKSLYCL